MPKSLMCPFIISKARSIARCCVCDFSISSTFPSRAVTIGFRCIISPTIACCLLTLPSNSKNLSLSGIIINRVYFLLSFAAFIASSSHEPSLILSAAASTASPSSIPHVKESITVMLHCGYFCLSFLAASSAFLYVSLKDDDKKTAITLLFFNISSSNAE